MPSPLEITSDSGGVILPSSGTMTAGVDVVAAGGSWLVVWICCCTTPLLLPPPCSISGDSGDARLGCTIPDRSMRCYTRRVSKAPARWRLRTCSSSLTVMIGPGMDWLAVCFEPSWRQAWTRRIGLSSCLTTVQSMAVSSTIRSATARAMCSLTRARSSSGSIVGGRLREKDTAKRHRLCTRGKCLALMNADVEK